MKKDTTITFKSDTVTFSDKTIPWCSSLDHIWAIPPSGKIGRNTPCYCGKRQWGVEHIPRGRIKREQDS